jgi:copper(I)-binding protein
VLLAQAGYPTDPGSTFGATTLASLKAFQTAAGLDATGSTNAKTWSRLFMLLEVAPTPTLTGATTVGKTLAVTAGTWGPGKVDVTYQWYRGTAAIASATGSSYTLQPADASQPIKVVATGSRATYTSVSRSSIATPAVTPATLTATPVPTITGSAVAGKTLTAVPGAWTPAPVTVTYQWYRGTTAISGATGVSYTLTAADYKQAISVRTTGARAGYYSVTTTSVATAAVKQGTLSEIGTPTISGTAKEGTVLVADPGTWGPGQIALAYQWYRGSTRISGATQNSYQLTSKDVGAGITVRVTSTTAAFASATKESKPTAKVAPAIVKFTDTPAPTITGTAAVGQTLTAVSGTWAPGPVTLTYQWYRGNSAIRGATAATYTLTASDYKKTISVQTVGSRAGYQTAKVTSEATAKIAQGRLTKTGTPTISGTRRAGHKLTAKPGTWGPGKIALAYQWYRGSAKISGATTSSYQLSSKDAGKTIKVRVTSRTTAFASVSKYSKATVKIAKPKG